MIDFFKKWFSRPEDIPQSSFEADLILIDKNNQLAEQIRELNTEILGLKSRKDKVEKFPIDISIQDPAPSKTEERKEYVAEVAGFHKLYLKKKLLHMIHTTHIYLESEQSKDQDLMYKGVVYAFRELLRWGNMMESERLQNVADAKETTEELEENKE